MADVTVEVVVELAGEEIVAGRLYAHRRSGQESATFIYETGYLARADAYLEIAEAIETRSPQASDDLAELWRRIALNILISNTDDHLRNHAFLHTQANQWRLSPAFDLNPNPKRLGYLRTSIDGGDPDASIEKLLRVSPYFRIKTDEARDSLAAVLAATLRWRELACSKGLSRDAIREMEPAFEHDQQAKARLLTGV